METGGHSKEMGIRFCSCRNASEGAARKEMDEFCGAHALAFGFVSVSITQAVKTEGCMGSLARTE